jgi:nucleoside-diphosphate-sugar epimerase
MRILVTGGGGMLGSKLINRLATSGKLCGQTISAIDRHDVVLAPPPPKSSFPITTFMSDFSAPAEAPKLLADKPDVIFHLAAIVSGEAEANFDKGYAINLDGTRNLLDAVRAIGGGYRPKFIFTSSIAVFGSPFPDIIDDDFLLAPLTSYGTQKAICEMLLSDYSRKGFIDGIGLRMPTVCVRPGKPNKAASGFFSNIIREPLAGQPANLPVSDTVRHWHISPRGAIDLLLHAAEMDSSKLGTRRNLSMPGLSCTVAEQLDALKDVAGADVLKLITREPDATIAGIVAGWPQNFTAARARALGFKSEQTFADIIRTHIADELTVK